MFGRKKRVGEVSASSLEDSTSPDVLNEGDSHCKHKYILYDYNGFGRIWRCDVPKCGRHERASYAQGQVLNIPSHALVRVQDEHDEFYTCKTDSHGEIHDLPRSGWVRRKK